jgi:large subunit ribosomal protein L13
MKTYSKKADEVTHAWILVDASGVPVGRLASFVATRLIGKYQPSYTPHMDSGDFVVIINADDAVLTGDKSSQKKYYHYSGYVSGIKTRTAAEQSNERIINLAVKGMLPKNKLQPERLKRLKIFAGPEHSHAAQKPQKLEVK